MCVCVCVCEGVCVKVCECVCVRGWVSWVGGLEVIIFFIVGSNNGFIERNEMRR